MVDAGLPCRTRSAGERAVVDQLDALVGLGHAVTMVALGHAPGGSDAATASELAGRGVTVQPGIGPAALAASLDGADAVVVHRPGPAVRAAPVLAAHPGCPVVYAGHDLHAARIVAGTALVGGDPRRARVVAVAERAAWGSADVVTYPTEGEAATVRARTGHRRVVAVPYYRLTDSDLVTPPVPAGGRRGLLMVGGADHEPNRDAVTHTVTDLLPRLRAAGIDDPITVVGEWPAPARARLEPAVGFTGRVPEAVLRELHGTHRLLLAPLRFGAGAKRKLVAAMGLGLPVVTTSVGATGLLVRDADARDGVRVGDDPEALVDAVVALSHPGSGDDQATRARRSVAAVYSTAPYDRAAADVLAAVGPRLGRSG